MQKINSTDRIFWIGTSDEGFPAGPFPDGSALIYEDNGQVWFGKTNTWTNVRPLSMTMDIPFGGLPDSVLLPSALGGSTSRQRVALGSSIPNNPLPGVEMVLIRMEEHLGALLAEMRIQNMMLHEAFAGVVSDDLEQLRAGVLAADETLTR